MTQWKSGNEFLPFHPQASHVNPDYRDGWNACFKAAESAPDPIRAALSSVLGKLSDITSLAAEARNCATGHLLACENMDAVCMTVDEILATLAGAQKQE